jgi:hypothetical protein
MPWGKRMSDEARERKAFEIVPIERVDMYGSVLVLPKKSPWLNAMEPKWIHGKRRWLSPTVCSAPPSCPSESARLSPARTTNVYSFPKMSADRALARPGKRTYYQVRDEVR